jgi:hypothetical protein
VRANHASEVSRGKRKGDAKDIDFSRNAVLQERIPLLRAISIVVLGKKISNSKRFFFDIRRPHAGIAPRGPSGTGV